MADDFELEDWLPMPPDKGPPLPRRLEVYWWWYEPAAEFKVSDLVIAPSEVEEGQPVLISCTVENAGDAAGSYTLKLGGDFMATQVVTLEPGESKVVSFEVTPTVAKGYSVTVDGLSGGFTATRKPAPDIRVENLTVTPSEVYVDEPVLISVTAKNYGDASGSKVVTCEVV